MSAPLHDRPSFVHGRQGALLVFLLNSLATIQLVSFYIQHVPQAMDLEAYEDGRGLNPFQHRVLLMLPMRWAHSSHPLLHWAALANSLPDWFPGGFTAEGLLQLAVNVLALAIAGLVARSIYRASSNAGLLTPCVYPLTLLMVAVTYVLPLQRSLRFIYDLPSLGFFAIGLYLIYFRSRPVYFIALFVIATINRETTLLLLPIYALTCFTRFSEKARGRRHAREPLLVLALLSAYWIGWHLWIVHHFAANPSAAGPRFLLNLGLLICPIAWPQLASFCCYLLPFVFIYRRHIPDPVLRGWLWIFPAWGAFMLWYGLLLEIRIFGELIPIVACTVVLIAEQLLLRKVAAPSLAPLPD